MAGRHFPGREFAAPFSLAARAPRCRRTFPARDLIVFLTFAVILVTLVGQGADAALADSRAARRGRRRRRAVRTRRHGSRASEAALARLEELEAGRLGARGTRPSEHEGSTGSARIASRARLPRASTRRGVEERSQQYQRLRRELLEAERQAVLRLRKRGDDHRGCDAARTARHRPRGTSASICSLLCRCKDGRDQLPAPRLICVTSPDREQAEQT